MQKHTFMFFNFGREPQNWQFRISTDSDAFTIFYQIRSKSRYPLAQEQPRLRPPRRHHRRCRHHDAVNFPHPCGVYPDDVKLSAR